MPRSAISFNGKRFLQVGKTHTTIVGAAATIATSMVSQTASMPGSVSVAAASDNSSFTATPTPSISLFSHRLNAGRASISSQPDASRTDGVPLPSIEKTTQASSSPIMTGVNISAHHNMEPSEDMLNPRQMGAIIGGSVGVTTIILIAIALFLILRRRRRRRGHSPEQATKPNCEKKAKIGKSRYISSSHGDRAADVSPDTPCVYYRVPLPSNALSFSSRFEQSNACPKSTLVHAGSLQNYTVRHFRKSSLPVHSRRLQGEVWNRLPSPNIQESVTRNSCCVTSTKFPDPFLDPPRNSELQSSLRRPVTHYDFYQNSMKTHGRSTSMPSKPDNNGRIESINIPNQYSQLPLNFGFKLQEEASDPLYFRMLPPFLPQHKDSIPSQTGRNSSSSSSVIILPGRSSASSSGIFEASASDLSLWRRNRSAQEGVIDTRRSDPFDLESPESGLTRSVDTDTWYL
ncbi:hypothetical protein AJ78_04768 [Emergomyces pasteurianus Ep9510]|uniref:Uncharacterized protein n=1 Tax=Emergomyces pasteurianus Ep9510 TaxID=1447872 RepID=A0A1J9PEK7_9EURO|nr:hypothetical protein AJ78_04768 [Emergomyces pasteurianus Ep9510]